MLQRGLLMALCLLACRYPSHAQYSGSFDSACRAATALPDPTARLARFHPLIDQSYASSVFQTIAFGKAYLKAASDIKSDSDLYQAHIILCIGYERNRDFEQSIYHGLEAVRIAGEGKDYRKQILAFQDIAFTYSSMGLMTGDKADFEKALYYCTQGLDIVHARGVRREEANMLTATADVYGMYKNYDTAISLYRQAIASDNAQGSAGTIGLYMNLGIALNLKGDYDGALAAYARADSLCDAQQGSAFYKMKIASNRAELYSDMGRLSESEQLAKEVLASAQHIGATDIQVDVVDLLKNLCRKQGRYQEALVYADTLAAIKERMLNAEKTGQVAEMQARYDAGVKDEQIAGQAQVIQQKRNQAVLLWVGIALLATAGTTAYIGMRRSSRLNKKIIAQQHELQQINEMKDKLFSLIGHDLRTPLNSLTAYATLLEQEDALSPEKAAQYSADLRLTLGRTSALMENLLHFAKTQMQATRAYPGVQHLSDIAHTAIDMLQPAMNRKDIRLSTHFSTDTLAWCDEDMTELILRNLLSNAIKFSEPGSAIAFSIGPHDEAFIYCTIRDHGKGMTPEQAALWNYDNVPVSVHSTAGTQQEKGAGLGLMLSKTFAGIMGGSLQVESEKGKGTAFTLILPRGK